MFSCFIDSFADFPWIGLDLDYKCSTIYVLVPSRANKAPSQCKVTCAAVWRTLWPPKQRWVCTEVTIFWHPYSDKLPTDENRQVGFRLLNTPWFLLTHAHNVHVVLLTLCQCVTYPSLTFMCYGLPPSLRKTSPACTLQEQGWRSNRQRGLGSLKLGLLGTSLTWLRSCLHSLMSNKPREHADISLS